MVTTLLGACSVVHVYGHNFVPHTNEAGKAAKERARQLVVHNLQWRGGNWQGPFELPNPESD